MRHIDKAYSRVSRYGTAVGRVMFREATLLSRQHVTRMLYSDYHEALGVAFDTAYGHFLEGAAVAADIESGLERFIEDEYRFLDDACSGTPVAEFMHLKYDFHNMRVISKGLFLGDAGDETLFSALGTVQPDVLKDTLEGTKSPGVPAMIAAAAEEIRREAESGGTDSQAIDTIIDRAFLEGRLDVALKTGSRPLEAFCRSAIDLANLLVLLRGVPLGKEASFYEAAMAEGGELPRRALLPLAGRPFPEVSDRLLNSRYGRLLSEAVEKGEERARLTTLDRISDDYLMEKVAGFSGIAVGPERVIRYMMTRENEVVIMRIIFVGKLNAVPTGLIEARLPAQYLKEKAVQG